MVSRGPATPHIPIPAVQPYHRIGAAPCIGASPARVAGKSGKQSTSCLPRTPIAHDLNQGTRRYRSPSEGVAAMTQAAEDPVLHILWMNGCLGCDGYSVALTAATQPSIEEIVLGALPGLPKVAVHWPLIDFECGPEQGADNFIDN